MKFLNVFLMVCSWMVFSNTQGFAQLKAEDLSVKVDKTAKKLTVFKKTDSSVVTASFKLTKVAIDIFDANGQYAGSLELKDWAIPLDEFSPDEIVKITTITMVEVSTGQTLVLKDIKLQLK